MSSIYKSLVVFAIVSKKVVSGQESRLQSNKKGPE